MQVPSRLRLRLLVVRCLLVALVARLLLRNLLSQQGLRGALSSNVSLVEDEQERVRHRKLLLRRRLPLQPRYHPRRAGQRGNVSLFSSVLR